MKKIIKIASFFLTLSIIFSMLYGISVFAQNGAETGMSSEDIAIAEYEAKAAIQREATQAYAALSDTFGVTEDGETIYPDDYAGAWIDDATLNVCLTSTESRDKYNTILKGYNCVVFEKGKYSLNELKSIQNKIFNALSTKDKVAALYTEVESNSIVFEVVEDPEVVEREVRELQASPEIIGEDSKDSNTIPAELIKVKSGSYTTPEADLRGGMKITRGSASGSGRSIGVCGSFTSNGTTYDGIVTAEHNLATSGTNQKIYRAGSDFGRVSLLMYQNNGNGDWAAVGKQMTMF